MENNFILNQIEIDEFNRTSAVLGINKPAGITSHDVVDQIRRALRTRKVGHAGALDPFATGVLIILVGNYTKLSDQLMQGNKEYKCKILLGVETDTLDPEGKVVKRAEISHEFNEEAIKEKINVFKDGYDQRVPIFSSVKVQGYKLRKLARQAASFAVNDDGSEAVFTMKDGKKIELEIPKRRVVFTKFELEAVGRISEKERKGLEFLNNSEVDENKGDKNEVAENDAVSKTKTDLWFIDLIVGCSKGTYIRQLAADIGKEIGLPAMLIALERTRVGDVTIESCVNANQISLSSEN